MDSFKNIGLVTTRCQSNSFRSSYNLCFRQATLFTLSRPVWFLFTPKIQVSSYKGTRLETIEVLKAEARVNLKTHSENDQLYWFKLWKVQMEKIIKCLVTLDILLEINFLYFAFDESQWQPQGALHGLDVDV